MDKIDHFLSLYELFAAINFGILAYNRSRSGEKNSFHSIMLSWVDKFYRIVDDEKRKTSITNSEHLFLERIVVKFINLVDGSKNYIKYTKGFTIACSFAGILCASVILFNGYYRGLCTETPVLECEYHSLFNSIYYVINLFGIIFISTLFLNDFLPYRKVDVEDGNTDLQESRNKIFKRHNIGFKQVLVIVIALLMLTIIYVRYNPEEWGLWYVTPILAVSAIVLYILRFFIVYTFVFASFFIYKFLAWLIRIMVKLFLKLFGRSRALNDIE